MLCMHNWHLFKCNRRNKHHFISAQKLCFSSCCLFRYIFVWTLLDSGCWVLASNIDATKWREKETGAYTAAQCSLGAITVKYGRDVQSQDIIEFFCSNGRFTLYTCVIWRRAYYTRTVFYTATIRLLVFCQICLLQCGFWPTVFFETLKHTHTSSVLTWSFFRQLSPFSDAI